MYYVKFILFILLCFFCALVFFMIYDMSMHLRLYIDKNADKSLVIKELSKWCIKFLAIIAIICFLLFGLSKNLVKSHIDKNTEKNNHTKEYYDAVKKIPFNDEIINEDETVWENLFNNFLMYKIYLDNIKESNNIDELREKYKREFDDLKDNSDIDMNMIINIIRENYGTEILPKTDMTLQDIDKKYSMAEDDFMSELKLYQAEFCLRAYNYSDNISSEGLLSIGRAAIDIFKLLCDNFKPTAKESIFYASSSVSFYLACLNKDERDINREIIYYRIGEVYIFLYKNIYFIKENKDYKCHCLLMAEVALMNAQKEFDSKNLEEDIHKTMPYFGVYYAEILEILLVEYGDDSESTINGCREKATMFLESSYTTKYDKCRKGCEDILDRLDEKYR